MKKALKIVGIIFGALFGLIGVATAVAAISGAFSHPEISIESLSWETDKVRVVEDFQATVNFLPENANQLDVELNLVYAEGANVVEFPKTVKAGEPFNIKLKKDANGNNVGGEVVIQAKTQLVVSQTNLKILVDVPIPNDGLVIASDFDTEDEQNILDAGASDFSLYVFTNPTKALNPNTGSDIDLNVAYKNIQIKSANTSKLQILDEGTQTTGFYCPKYIEHEHTGPFKNANGVKFTTTTCDHGTALIPYKYIEYRARALESTQAPVIVTAKALRTYDMQEQYVDKSDAKYYENGEMTSDGRQQFLTDLSNYVAEFQDYLKTDTRVNYDSINASTVNYESGAAFIEAITKTNANGEKYIKIEDNRVHEEAAYFYLFVESRTLFNIEQIEIADVQSSYETSGRKVDFNLFDEVQQYDVADLKTIFDVSLKPTSDEFTSSDLEHRLKEIRVMAIMNKNVAEGEEDPYPNYDFEPNNYVFEIENPVSKDTPIWKVRCINSIKETDKQRAVRLRFYVPSSQTGDYTMGDPHADVPVQILINDVGEFKLYDTGATALATDMVINTEDVDGKSYRQELNSSRYILTGMGNQAPTYTTVKFFATSESAKTKLPDGTATSFFKANLSNSGTPTLLTMTHGEAGVIEAYEISYKVAGKNYLEAINVTDGSPLEVFAAVIKTDHNGKALDTEGVPEDDPAFNGNYQVIRRSANTINISINYYLEKLNFYTINDAGTYTLRNVPETGTGNTETVQLLAGSFYNFKVTPYELTEAGEFNAQSPKYSNTLVDYQTNLKWATNYAYNYGLLSFNTDSPDVSIYENNYDTTMACYNLTILAVINKTASAGYVAEAFDYRAFPTGVLYNTFSSTRSTVNMIVNYADISSFYVNTTTDEEGTSKDYYVLSPVIEELTDSSDPGIKWRDTEAKSTDFAIKTNYSLDIQHKDGDKFNSKIDSCYGSESYVEDYVKMMTNPNATDKFSASWKLEFDHLDGLQIDGTQISGAIDSSMKVEDFITITEIPEIDPENPELATSKTVFNIKKGTPLGVFIKATCTIKLYQTNTGYIETESAVINLVLKQSAVQFEMYSPFVIESADSLVVNQAGESAAFVLDGGGNDGTLTDGYDLLADYGTSTAKRDVYEWKNDYVKVEGKQAYNLVNAILDDDGELAGWCTFVINDTANSPIYFKNEGGQKTYTAMPKKVTVGGKSRFQLVVYAEHISTSSSATITITDPFGDKTATYNLFVRSSITLSKEKDGVAYTGNIETRTTNADGGKIDLSSFYKAKQGETELQTSFVFIDEEGKVSATSPYATITSGKYLTPKEVLSNKVVKIGMYYTLEDSQYLITEINNSSLAVLITPGYQIEINTEIQNSEAKKISINSGVTKNFYSEYATSPDQFIKIKNLAESVYISSANMETMLTKLIRLSFDEDLLSASELAIFNTLFTTSTDKNAINMGELRTRAITNNIMLPIRINFLEGAVVADAITTGNETYVATFYVEVKASVDFAIKAVNIENETYDSSSLVLNGQEIENAAIGHVYSKINVDKDSDGQIDLGEYNITLFDSSLTPETNILSLSGDDGVELLNSTFISYVLYRLDYTTGKYLEVVSDYNVAIVTTSNESGLQTLVLNIKNSVNQDAYYKLAIKTSVNKDGETFDYFFTLLPTYQLKVNYPIVTGPEKVTAGSTIDLFTNFINTHRRYEVYRMFGAAEYIYGFSLDANTPNLYLLTSTEESLTEKVLLSDNETLVTFSVVEGAGYASTTGSKITFGNPGAGSQIIKVRITLFNGAYTDYEFELFASLNIPAISINDGNSTAVEAYAGNSVNILDYISANSTPDGFKFVIKYNSYASVVAKVNGQDLNDVNQIIDYSGNQLLVEFADVESETIVSFGVWHTYSVDGNPDSQATLNIKLLPNLQVKVNKTSEGKNVVTELVAGVETQIVSQTDTTWLKISNDNYAGISIDLTQVDGVEYKTTANPVENYLGVTISEVTQTVDSEEKVVGFKFISSNIGYARNLVFTVTKSGELTYEFTFEITLVPNIKLNSAYITGNAYSITAAAGAEMPSGKLVNLNSIDGVFKPTDYSNNPLKLAEDNGNAEGTVTFTAEHSDAYGNTIANTPYALVGANVSKDNLNVTVAAVNTDEKVFIKVTFTWVGGVEPYEAVISLVIVPNLAGGTNADKVEYSTENYLPVFAGSTVELSFANSLEISQSGKTAKVIAKQETAVKDYTNVNIVLNIDAHANSQTPVYYQLYVDSGRYYIFFKGVPAVQMIEIPVYYDLTGKISGLKTSSEINFNDAKVVKPSGKVVRFRISPSISQIAYTSADHTTEANAINMTQQLLDVYNNGEYDTTQNPHVLIRKYDNEGNIILTAGHGVMVTDGSAFNQLEINSGTEFVSRYTWLGKVDDNSDDIFYNVNAFDLLSLFTFTPETGVTFTTDPTKIYSNLSALYSSINYSVSGKMGRAVASTDTWEEISRPEQYYTIDKERGILYIIPPKQIGEKNAMLLKVDVQLPGKTGATSTQTVYLKLQFAGEYEFSEGVKVQIGNGGEIINKFEFAQQTTDTLTEVTTTHGIDLNKTKVVGTDTVYVTEYNLNDYFNYGFLLRSYEEENLYYTESINKTARYAFVQRGTGRYKYYLLDNVGLSYRFIDNKSSDFASIEVREDGTYLIPNVYFQEAGAEIRSVQIEVTAGSISKTYKVYIHPRTASHNFEFDDTDETKFVHNLTTSVEGEVPVYSSEIEILQEDLALDEYELVQSWLHYETMDDGTERKYNFTFVPDLNQLKSTITVKFKNTISVDSAQNQIFEEYLTITLTPNVGLTYNKADGVETELTTTETPIIVGASGTSSLFDTKVFALSNNGAATSSAEADYYNVNLTLTETNTDADYAEYIRFTDVFTTTDENDLNTYKIINVSKIMLLPNQILLNVSLPFTATLTFTNEGVVYTITHNFSLLIKANAGITNLQSSYIVDAAEYSVSNPTVVQSYTETVTLGSGSNPALSGVKVIGTGVTISFEVLDNVGVSGNGIPTLSELRNCIVFDMPGFTTVTHSSFATTQAGEQEISSIVMNFNGLFTTYPGLVALNSISFNVVYTVDGESTILKTITLTIQNGFHSGYTG